MSIQDLVAEGLKQMQGQITIGSVTNFYVGTYKIDVLELNTQKKINQIPIASLYAGATHGLMATPQNGDLAVIAYIHGSIYDPVCIGFLYTDVNQKPLQVKDRMIIKHTSGATIVIEPEGDVIVTPADGKNYKLGGSAAEQGVPLGDDLKSWLDSHTHPTGVGPSGAPFVGSPNPSSVVKVVP